MPKDGAAFHPLGQQLADENSVVREAIHRVELLADDTGVMLAEARGDQECYESILTDSEYVIDYAVTGTEGRWYSYTHFKPTKGVQRMIERRAQSDAMMEMPISVHPDGSMDIMFVGDAQSFSNAPTPPPDLCDVELLETGIRPPRADDFFASLTARQQEVLEVALNVGYYENPRRATHEVIAECIDLAPSTIGEHLRKIEARVFSQFNC